MIVGALVLLEVTAGVADASMMRSPLIPCARNSSSGGGNTMARLHYFYFAAGAIILLILQFHFVLSWDALYAPHPWRGYAPGVAPPFISTSPRSLLIANFVLFTAALGLTLIPSGKQAGVGAAQWAGVISAVVLVWVATARLRQDSNMWPID